MLTVKDAYVSYLRKEILQGLSMRVEKGEIVLLVGANGSGKSTLLKAIAGLIKPVSGSISFENVDITGMRSHEINRLGVAYLIQGGEVFPTLTIRENIALALRRFGKAEYHDRAAIAYDAFPKIAKISDRRAGLLSGGEREMLAISLVIIQKPRLMLIDEPSAGLAPALVSELLPKIRDLSNRLGASVLLVEQNVRQALAVSDRVYKLADGRALEVEKEQTFDYLLAGSEKSIMELEIRR
jgi:branched-chain amino acid transport system ATP-binding protein